MNINLSHTTKRPSLVLGALAVLVAVLALASPPGLFDSRYEKSAKEVFGSKSGEPIATGFLFKDGTYLDAPYVVSRRAADIYVNDVRVVTFGPWPPPDYDDKKPEMPATLTKHSTFKDLEIPKNPGDSLDRMMIRWMRRHYDKDQAKSLIADYYKSLPFVKGARWSTRMVDVLEVSTWDSDEPRLIGVRGYVPRPVTPEAALKELEESRSGMEGRLKNGECLFLFSGGGELSFGSRKAAMDLGTIVRTLRSDMPKARKITELRKLGLFPPELPKKWEVLVTNFSASPQLDERVRQLRLPPGDKGEREPTPEEERARLEKMLKERAAKEKKVKE